MSRSLQALQTGAKIAKFCFALAYALPRSLETEEVVERSTEAHL